MGHTTEERRERQFAFALNMGESAAIVAVMILVLAALTQ